MKSANNYKYKCFGYTNQVISVSVLFGLSTIRLNKTTTTTTTTTAA